MADLPKSFSAPMVKALLAGTKTQTRRLITPRGKRPSLFRDAWSDEYILDPGNAKWLQRDLPCKAGDRLYVREAYSGPYDLTGTPPRDWHAASTPIHYWAEGDPTWGDWTKPKPAMHMPKWASRLTLIVIGCRAERLQDISEADAKAEGVSAKLFGAEHGREYTRAYITLWNELHADRPWKTNPWVSVTEFEVKHGNINQLEGAK